MFGGIGRDVATSCVGVMKLAMGWDEADGFEEGVGNRILRRSQDWGLALERVAVQLHVQELLGLANGGANVDPILFRLGLGNSIVFQPPEDVVNLTLVRRSQREDVVDGQADATRERRAEAVNLGLSQGNGHPQRVRGIGRVVELVPSFGEDLSLLEARRRTGTEAGKSPRRQDESRRHCEVAGTIGSLEGGQKTVVFQERTGRESAEIKGSREHRQALPCALASRLPLRNMM